MTHTLDSPSISGFESSLMCFDVPQERVDEMRKLREAFENDKKLEMMSLQSRLEEEKKKEV